MTRTPLDISMLLRRRVAFESSFAPSDVILYHIGLGLGTDPMNEAELRFVYEKKLMVLPSYAAILGLGPSLVTEDDGLDLVKMLHGEQSIKLHRPIPVAGRIGCEMRIGEIIDKGPGKGCLIVEECEVTLNGGERLASLRGTGFYRGDGGRGGTSQAVAPPHFIPDRAPDKVLAIATRPDQAILYRLNGDYNPLHIDPATARAAGFARPILHGLCSYGIACRAIVEAYAPSRPDRVGSLAGRFSSPVYPGETIVTELWRDADSVSYRCKVKERDMIVLDHGCATLG